MKLNRLLEITMILLNRKTVTAAELAERFGVSTRTIYRDIDVLSGSGVPVYSTQGSNGGISIMEDYTLHRASLSDKECEQILFGLKSLQAAKYPDVEAILDKLGALFHKDAENWLSIDFSPWGSSPNEKNRFEMIKDAILKTHIIEIDYINAYNIKSKRKIAPLKLGFKSQAWYLYGYCFERSDYRTFRISRIKNTVVFPETFNREALIPVTQKKQEILNPHSMVHLVLRFTDDVLHRLYDDYEEYMLQNNHDGTYTVELDFPEDDWVYGYILSFGPYVKVISPPHLQRIIKEKCLSAAAHYD